MSDDEDWVSCDDVVESEALAEWTLVNTERSASMCSYESSYSYESSCTEDAWVACALKKETRDGRVEEAHMFEEAVLASREDFVRRGPRWRFFSATGAPLDLQLRVASCLTCVESLNALDSTCKWMRRRSWRATTRMETEDEVAFVEALSLAEAAAATILVRFLGFHGCLPATNHKSEPYAKRFSLARAAVLESSYKEAFVATSESAGSRENFTYLNKARVSTFDDATLFRRAAKHQILGLVSLKGPWRLFIKSFHDHCCHVAFPNGHDGYVDGHLLKRAPFPIKEDFTFSQIPRMNLDTWQTKFNLRRPPFKNKNNMSTSVTDDEKDEPLSHTTTHPASHIVSPSSSFLLFDEINDDHYAPGQHQVAL